jgi:FkbM family methyltransferase
MNILKKFIKQHSHSVLVKPFAGLGRSINRFYENRNHDVRCNGEFWMLQKISTLSPMVIFDGGANVGDYTQMINETCPDSKIYAFEPVESTFQELQKCLNSNEIINATAIQKGLYKEDTKVTINIYSGNEHASLHQIKGVGYQSIRQEVLDVVKGDTIMKEYGIETIDLLKLDIEGAEMDALVGFENALKGKKIRVIQFEYGYINITSKVLLADYYDFFSAHGYIVGKLYPRSVEFREYSFKHEDFIGPNFIAIQKSDVELKRLLS